MSDATKNEASIAQDFIDNGMNVDSEYLVCIAYTCMMSYAPYQLLHLNKRRLSLMISSCIGQSASQTCHREQS